MFNSFNIVQMKNFNNLFVTETNKTKNINYGDYKQFT